MRNYLLLASATTLAACGGGSGVETVGGVAVTAPTGGTTTTSSGTDVYAQFASPIDAKTYSGIGGDQVFTYTTDDRVVVGQQGQTYSGNASTVRNSNISIAYDPRDAIFTLTVGDGKTGASTNTRFQDPGSRTNFGGSQEPQWGTPDLTALPAGAAVNTHINYLQAGDGDPLSLYRESGSGFIYPGTNTTPPNGDIGASYTSTSFFYERPGSTTKYVTFAGYVRNSVTFGQVSTTDANGVVSTYNQDTWHLERGAFAYGAQTANSAVPVSGTGTYSGSVLATMVYNPTLDDASPLPSYFQWLTGASKVTVDFGAKTVGLALSGYVLNPQYDRFTTPGITLPAGTSFTANGSAAINLAGSGGFTGSFVGGAFTFKNGATVSPVSIAGSSIDGAFFGPKAEEVGGGFRVVGGTPDQRIDIIGAFTGKQ